MESLSDTTVTADPSSPPNAENSGQSSKRSLKRWLAVMVAIPVIIGGLAAWYSSEGGAPPPLVKPPVPPHWQSEADPFAGFSIPQGWTLQSNWSDQAGDSYYSGTGGAAGESVTVSGGAAPSAKTIPDIIGVFMRSTYHVTSITPIHLPNATSAWRYSFTRQGGAPAEGIQAWVEATGADVWLVIYPPNQVTSKVLSTLTLAS